MRLVLDRCGTYQGQQCTQNTVGERPYPIINPGGPTAAGRRAMRFLEGNDRVFEQLFRVPKAAFGALVLWLRDNTSLRGTRYQSLKQKVMVFLYILGQGCTQRAAAHFFEISQSSVSSIIKSAAAAFEALHQAFVTQPDDDFLCEETALQPGVHCYHSCIGAVDGTYVDTFIPSAKQRK